MIATVVGMGSIGKRHARNLAKHVDLINCVDRVSFDASGIETNIVRHTPEMLASAVQQSDLVIISTPHSLHLRQMQLCVELSKPFLVEKPIASNTQGIESLCVKSEKTRLVNQVGYNLRFHPTVAAVKRMIDSAEVGRILHASFEYGSYLPNWRPGSSYKENYAASREDGGILLDDIHEIDLACHLLGAPEFVQCVTTNTGDLGIPNEEAADITMIRHPKCPTSTVHMDYLQRAPTRRLKIVGTAGTLEADLIEYKTRFVSAGRDEIIHQEKDTNLMYEREMTHFLESIKSGQPDSSLTIRCGFETLNIALLARKSSKLGKWEKV